MSDWVTVPDSLVAEALNLVLGYLQQSRPNETSDFPACLIDGLIAYFKEAGGCDHAVGICACAEEAAVAELLLAKGGELTCRLCGGSGSQWSREQYDAAVAKARAEDYPYDVSDWAGYVECDGCDGRGVARMDTVLEGAAGERSN